MSTQSLERSISGWKDHYGLAATIYTRKRRPRVLDDDSFMEPESKPLRTDDDVMNALKEVCYAQVTTVLGDSDIDSGEDSPNHYDHLTMDLIACVKTQKARRESVKRKRNSSISASSQVSQELSDGDDDDDQGNRTATPATARKQKKVFSDLLLKFQVMHPVYKASNGKSYQPFNKKGEVDASTLSFDDELMMDGANEAGVCNGLSDLKSFLFKLLEDRPEYADGKGECLIGTQSTIFLKHRKDTTKLTKLESTEDLHNFALRRCNPQTAEVILTVAAGVKEANDTSISELNSDLEDARDFTSQQSSPPKMPRSKRASAARREAAQKIPEELTDFLQNLYQNPESPWFHGFGEKHRELLEKVLCTRKFGGGGGEERTNCWEHFSCDGEGTWPGLQELLDFSNDMILTRVDGRFPERGAYEPTPGSDQPPTWASEPQKSDAEIIAAAIKSASTVTVVQGDTSGGTSSTTAGNGKTDIVVFTFTRRIEDVDKSLSVSVDVKKTQTWAEVIRTAFHQDYHQAKTGVFSAFPKSTITAFKDGTKVMQYKFIDGELGTRTHTEFKETKLIGEFGLLALAGLKRPIVVEVGEYDALRCEEEGFMAEVDSFL